jgi:hypothetical protein
MNSRSEQLDYVIAQTSLAPVVHLSKPLCFQFLKLKSTMTERLKFHIETSCEYELKHLVRACFIMRVSTSRGKNMDVKRWHTHSHASSKLKMVSLYVH